MQVNNSHTDWRRTGSLYAIDDVKEVVAPDNVWFTEYIKVTGNHVVVKINDKTVVDFTQPTDVPPPDKKGQLIQAAPLHCRTMIPAALYIAKTLW